MTGWTQFTARFQQERHADAIVEDAEASPHRTPYAESLRDIARVRIVGYDNHENAVGLLEAAGPVELALVADFNDTTDSGEVSVYKPQYKTGWAEVPASATCPEASRWGFSYSVGGLTETGERAGCDFSLEEKYGDASRKVIPLEEMERVTDEAMDTLKTAARVNSVEYHRNL